MKLTHLRARKCTKYPLYLYSRTVIWETEVMFYHLNHREKKGNLGASLLYWDGLLVNLVLPMARNF